MYFDICYAHCQDNFSTVSFYLTNITSVISLSYSGANTGMQMSVMRTKLIIISLLLVLTIALWFVQAHYLDSSLSKTFYTALSLFAIYVVIKVIFEQIIATRIKESKTRYSMKRIVSMVSVLVFIAAAIAIWVDNLHALLVSYGVLETWPKSPTWTEDRRRVCVI